MDLLNEIEALGKALMAVTKNCFHYEATKQTGQYIVWAEEGQADDISGFNKKIAQAIDGTIDYFTKKEFDLNFAKIQQVLTNAGIQWELNSIQFERETGYIHYEWIWQIWGDPYEKSDI